MTLSLMPVKPATGYGEDRRVPGFRRFSMTARKSAVSDESNAVTDADEISHLKRGIAFILLGGLIPILIGWLIYTFCPRLLQTDLTSNPAQVFLIIRTDPSDYISSGSVGGLSRHGWLPVDQLQLHGIVTAE